MRTKNLQVTILALVLPCFAACEQTSTATADETKEKESGLAAGAESSVAALATTASLPNFYIKRWTACAEKDSHVKKGLAFNITPIRNRAGQYAIVPAVPADWSANWTSLVLTVEGWEDKDIPPVLWENIGCRHGKKVTGDPTFFKADPGTRRLRGGLCLPDGVANHADASCSGGAQNEYHEIVIFAREERDKTGGDSMHLVMQHCSRGELGDNIDDYQDYQCPVDWTKTPHPGHVHGDP